jgi:AcrR family transcriptional regulator
MPKLTAIRKRALDEMMRTAIFEATVAVLAEHGVKGLTMERVALAAKVAKGSLYYYFPSKKAILEFVVAKLMDPIFQNLQEVVASQRPAIEKLGAHLDMLLKHVAQYAQVFVLLFGDDAAQAYLFATHRRNCEEGSRHLAEVFRQGIAEGAFREADPLLLTHMFHGLSKAVFDSRPALGEPEQRETVYRLIMDAFLDGIGTDACRRGGRRRSDRSGMKQDDASA